MNRMTLLIRLVSLTAFGLLTAIFLSAPASAASELPVVVHESHTAAEGKAAVRFRAFNAPGGKDVYFGVTDGATDLPTKSMAYLDWVNEAAWGTSNPFTITYSAATGELSVSITVESGRGKHTDGTTTTYIGVGEVGDLGVLDYVQWTIANRAEQQQVTSAAVGVRNLVVNGVALGSYVVEEGTAPVVMHFALDQIDLTDGLTITGELVQSGKHSAAPDANLVEFMVGHAEPSVQDEAGDAEGDADSSAEADEQEQASESDGTEEADDAVGEDDQDSSPESDGGDGAGDEDANDNNDNDDDQGNDGNDGIGEDNGDSDGVDESHEGNTDTTSDSDNTGDDEQVRDTTAKDDIDTPAEPSPTPTPGEDRANDSSPADNDGQQDSGDTAPAAGDSTEPDTEDVTTPTAPDEEAEAPTTGPVDDQDASQDQEGFTAYLPAMMQMASMANR